VGYVYVFQTITMQMKLWVLVFDPIRRMKLHLPFYLACDGPLQLSWYVPTPEVCEEVPL